MSLGSNSENAKEKLAGALLALRDIDGMQFLASSRLYCTEPQEYREQPWFYNMVVMFRGESSLDPSRLLMRFLAIEKDLGRRRDDSLPRFGPRPIDIDLLLFGERIGHDPFCLLPHPRMHRRAFVLVPLQEIAPSLTLMGKSISFYLSRLAYRVQDNIIYQAQEEPFAGGTLHD